MKPHLVSRRAALGALGATAALTISPETARGFLANDTLQVGCIGAGGRSQRLLTELNQLAGVKVTAICDVWDANREAGMKLADPKGFACGRLEELLARPDVDAVLIGTPDHWHVPATIAACQAKKDVYVEKPLTHDLSEGQSVIDAQNDHQRIVQVGTQQRSMPHLQKACEIVQSGQLGPIRKVHLTWNRNTPRWRRQDLGISENSVDWSQFLGTARAQPFDEHRFRHWRWFWDFGGGVFTDLMVHWIDVVHWYLKLDEPKFAASAGDFFNAAGVWETPDSVQTLLRYPDSQVQAHFEGTFYNARLGAMCEFMGSEATLYIDRGRYEVIPERRSRVTASELIVGEGPRGADFYDQPNGESLHLANWVDCCRSRQRPNAPAEAGVSAAAAAHWANRALRQTLE